MAGARPGSSRLAIAWFVAWILAMSDVATAEAPSPGTDSPRTVVSLHFDGFSPQCLTSFDTPSFDRLAREGAYTRPMDPAFPTISLINGMTISTGCWPEHHGIVTNIFIDPVRGRYDHDSDADWLTGCEHPPQAAERQGVKTAALSWYGRLSSEKGPQASIVRPRPRHRRRHCTRPAPLSFPLCSRATSVVVREPLVGLARRCKRAHDRRTFVMMRREPDERGAK